MRDRQTPWAPGAVQITLLAALLAAGCGGDDDGTPTDGGPVLDGAPRDANIDMDAALADGGEIPDATFRDVTFPIDGGQCPAWELEPVSISTLLVAESEGLHTGRSARILATLELGGCDRRAAPEISIDAESMTVNVTMRAWTPGPRLVCTEDLKILSRPFVTTFPAPGEWTIRDTEGGATITVTVEGPPGGSCRDLDTGDDCQRDCDCPADDRCLSGMGPAGTLQQCARPCEMDLDCPQGRCVSFVDGLDLVCEPGLTQCDTGNPCPEGYECTDGSCDPLAPPTTATRVECECNVDCEAPHVCVIGADGSSRCEVRCLTRSDEWCGAGHACGGPDDDADELASSDSVCVATGE